MTLFEGEQNGRYETDHLHMVLNEHIDFTEEGLSDDRKYSIFVHGDAVNWGQAPVTV